MTTEGWDRLGRYAKHWGGEECEKRYSGGEEFAGKVGWVEDWGSGLLLLLVGRLLQGNKEVAKND